MGVVFWKELADHFSSRRFMILLIIVLLFGLWGSYSTGQAIRQNSEVVPPQFVFCCSSHPAVKAYFPLRPCSGFFGPLVGITLGFDSISGEYARGTLSRVLSQPIYRDSLINGKFFAGLADHRGVVEFDPSACYRARDHAAGVSSQHRRTVADVDIHLRGRVLRRLLAGPRHAIFAAVSKNRHSGARLHGSVAFHAVVHSVLTLAIANMAVPDATTPEAMSRQ